MDLNLLIVNFQIIIVLVMYLAAKASQKELVDLVLIGKANQKELVNLVLIGEADQRELVNLALIGKADRKDLVMDSDQICLVVDFSQKDLVMVGLFLVVIIMQVIILRFPIMLVKLRKFQVIQINFIMDLYYPIIDSLRMVQKRVATN